MAIIRSLIICTVLTAHAALASDLPKMSDPPKLESSIKKAIKQLDNSDQSAMNADEVNQSISEMQNAIDSMTDEKTALSGQDPNKKKSGVSNAERIQLLQQAIDAQSIAKQKLEIVQALKHEISAMQSAIGQPVCLCRFISQSDHFTGVATVTSFNVQPTGSSTDRLFIQQLKTKGATINLLTVKIGDENGQTYMRVEEGKQYASCLLSATNKDGSTIEAKQCQTNLEGVGANELKLSEQPPVAVWQFNIRCEIITGS